MDISLENKKARTAIDEREYLARAVSLRELIQAEAEKPENEQKTSLKVVEALREAGLYWLLVPRSVGGSDISAVGYSRVVEELASAHGSTGWSYMANAVATMVAGTFCTDEHVAHMFGGPRLPIMAATYAPTGKCVRDGDGYIGSGRFGFGSGISHSDWIGSAFVLNEDGMPAMQGDGKPRVLGAFMKTKDVDVVGNWDVVGLEATGSFDYVVSERKIPESSTFNQYWTEPKRPSHTATLGTIVAACTGHTAELIGIARRSLHEAARSANAKKRLYSTNSIADTPTFKLDFARNEALFQAARALFYDTIGAGDRKAETGISLTEAEVQRVRQVSTWVHQVCRDVVAFAYGSVSSSLRNPSVLGRNLVDAAVGAQHLIVNHMTMVDAAPTLIEQWAELSAQHAQ